jgi:glycerol-3-phosphate dehydrogenase subunit C
VNRGFHPEDARQPFFRDEDDFGAEARRVFQVCFGCRRCEPFCPVFPSVFSAIEVSGVAGLPADAIDRSAGLCYQCTLCYQNCPYTPPHPWCIDMPHLLLRSALLRRRAGNPPGLRFRSNLELTGAIGGLTVPWSNRLLGARSARALMERVWGIPRDRPMPEFCRVPFERWFQKRVKRFRRRVRGDGGKAALFCTCMVNHHYPAIGRSTVAVLHHNDVEAALPPQRCCGLPYPEAGEQEAADGNIRENAGPFVRLVDQGFAVVVPEASCAYMLSMEAPWLVPDAQVRRMASQVLDLSAYLLRLHRQGRLRVDFHPMPLSVSYHYADRLRVLHAGTEAGRTILEEMRDEETPTETLFRLVPGLRVRRVEHPSGLDGILGLSADSYREALPIARELAREMVRDSPDLLVTECSQAALLIRRETGCEVLHPAEVLRRAYGIEEPW